MPTLSTASTYIAKINDSYPEAGKDNNTQGFRDNFKNIKLSLQSSDEDVYSLKLNSVTLTNPINDFNYNVLKRTSLLETGNVVYDNSSVIQTGDVTIDYKNGSYQKFNVSGGIHWFSVENWPGDGISGALTLVITKSSTATTYINFNALNVYNLGQDDLPVNITDRPYATFHLWSDGDVNNLYVKQVDQNYTFTKPAILASYSTGTLAALGTTTNGSMVFVTNFGKPAYHNNGIWYLMTGTAITL